jgi:hypothetical protein
MLAYGQDRLAERKAGWLEGRQRDGQTDSSEHGCMLAEYKEADDALMFGFYSIENVASLFPEWNETE